MEHIREQIQDNLEESGDDYILKTDAELIDIISDFGCGETEFHTADIERLIREKHFLEERLEGFVELVDLLRKRNKLENELKEFQNKIDNIDKPADLRHPEIFKRIEELCYIAYNHNDPKTNLPWTVTNIARQIIYETENYFKNENKTT